MSHNNEYALQIQEKDGVTIHYSKGYAEKAETQLNRISQMKSYFNNKLGVAIKLKVHLLDQQDWKNIVGEDLPYGLPFVTDDEIACITLPATKDGVVAQEAIRYKDTVSSEVMDAIHAIGYTFEEAAILYNDLIGYHEIGHIITFDLGLTKLNNWVNEFMATFFAYAYMMENVPEYAKIWDANAQVIFYDGTLPTYTKMSDFDHLYGEVGVENYDWYQKQFAKLVARVYEEQGIEFAYKIKEALQHENVDTEMAFEKLGRISQLFLQWRKEVEGI